MATLFDYLTWRGDLTFNQSPFNPVDNIILSQLAYLPFDNIVPGPDEKKGITIGKAAEIFYHELQWELSTLRGSLLFKDDPDFISALGASERFRHCELWGFVNHIDISMEKQFSAVTVKTNDNFLFIAYRGTDASFVAWKEDFNMGFRDVIPAQQDAVAYLEKMAHNIRKPLRLGGHSKGGNLAVYAAAFCKPRIRKRILKIYSNDAPGFHHQVIASEGYQKIKERILSFVPQSSVVGMLFEHEDNYMVIRSSQSGLMQHDLYSWEVAHNDLIYLDQVTQSSRFVDNTLREWIDGLDYEHREQFAGALYYILNASQAKSFAELGSDWFKAAGRMIQSLRDIDEETRKLVGKTLAALFRAARNNFNVLLKPEIKKRGLRAEQGKT